MATFTIILATISILIAALTLWFTIHSFGKQLKLNFFANYTKRYQEIMLHLPFSIYNEDFNFNDLKADEKEQILKYMRAYFDLCSEEYHLWKNGNINKDVWEEWKSGIDFAFSKSQSPFVMAWEGMDKNTYPEFSEYVENKF